MACSVTGSQPLPRWEAGEVEGDHAVGFTRLGADDVHRLPVPFVEGQENFLDTAIQAVGIGSVAFCHGAIKHIQSFLVLSCVL